MIRERFHHRETHATLLAEEEGHLHVAKAAILEARAAIERTIARDPFFLSSLEPCDPGVDHPVIRRMVRAARDAGVGPMASVAGMVAAAGVEAMVGAGASFGVVENGGDIAFVSPQPLRIGVHAGASAYSDRFAFVLPPTRRVLGCCTSSATVGPSISFGVADAVTVFGPDPVLADAWATRLCNDLRPEDRSVLDRVDPAQITGVCAVFDRQVVRWGSLPPVVRARVDPALITSADSL
ncbi:MAG TPA: UPF0280 family protein [Methanoregulaceae archaeon]|nr:UPF0280 family protein [Methanoregulaceae archaeon]HOV67154.1 UPF0280 family protein [Methanoregulaceae archaeon]HQJ87032.1 UPF0280 family protein [Methanoregulaceae archaeon]